MMNKITLILGGARSGKSTYALKLADKYKEVAFVATCQVLDKEMEDRIKLHKRARPKHWQSFEEPKDVDLLLKKIPDVFNCIVIDCLTLLVSNLLLSGNNQKEIEDKIKKILSVLKNGAPPRLKPGIPFSAEYFRGQKPRKYKKTHAIIVSNEVGLGIVPEHKSAREFRDIAGRVNQLVAREADEVWFLAAGLPLKIKNQGGVR